MRIPGLGLYPDQPCFDPDRPALLPYWIDDLTESDCKYNATNILGATANAAGEAVGAVAGAAGSAIGTAASTAASQFTLSSGMGLAAIGIGVMFLLYAFTRR